MCFDGLVLTSADPWFACPFIWRRNECVFGGGGTSFAANRDGLYFVYELHFEWASFLIGLPLRRRFSIRVRSAQDKPRYKYGPHFTSALENLVAEDTIVSHLETLIFLHTLHRWVFVIAFAFSNCTVFYISSFIFVNFMLTWIRSPIEWSWIWTTASCRRYLAPPLERRMRLHYAFFIFFVAYGYGFDWILVIVLDCWFDCLVITCLAVSHLESLDCANAFL